MAKKEINKSNTGVSKNKPEIVLLREPKNIIMSSFSAGETSAVMTLLICEKYHKDPDFKICISFANTGEETEKSLLFAHRMTMLIKERYGLEVTWLEYDWGYKIKKWKDGEPVYSKEIGSTFKIIDFKTAYRSHDPEEKANKWLNHPFRKFIQRYGIPNQQNFSCTRELKERTIRRYYTSIGMQPRTYTIAIGIRADEMDRLSNPNMWYPMALWGLTKPDVNTFMDNMPFRLNQEGWQGNCKCCWKKSGRKLVTKARKEPEDFGFYDQMEKEFGYYVPENVNPDARTVPAVFYRENRSVKDIFELAKDEKIPDAQDDSIIYVDISDPEMEEFINLGSSCSESCEPFKDEI